MSLLPTFTSISLPLILLLISIHYTSSASSKLCASSPSCGNITISYPFSFIDPYASSDSYSYCGYPGLQLHCYKYDQDIPILFLGSENYTVTDINYEAGTISLKDTEILLQTASNPRIDHNVSLTSNIWLNYTVLVINITFFFNCDQFQSNYSSTIIPSPAGTMPGKYSYVFPTAALPLNHSKWVTMCEEMVVVPVLGQDINSQLQNLASNYGSVLRDGFQLEWSNALESEDCLKCEKQRGQCGYNVTSNSNYASNYTHTCFCKYHLLRLFNFS